MDIDDDMPPELVETGQGGGTEDSLEKPVKVPITIVTGELLLRDSMMYTVITLMARVSGRWKNYSAQLYSDSPAWQEDCGYYERVWRLYERRNQKLSIYR